MGVFRIYPEKSNTIASGVYQGLNAGQNAIAELWYGGGGTDTAPQKRNSISRFIVKFDIAELQNKLNTFEINPAFVNSYTLNLTNSIPRDLALEDEYEYDVLYKKVACSFDLICFPLNMDFDEGRGYDLIKEKFIVKQKGDYAISGVSNWNNATTVTSWSAPGIYTDPTASTTFHPTQHFPIGDEDICMNITDVVRDWLSGGSVNNGVGIAYRRDYELSSGNTRYISSFYTEKTNTAFKPYIEVSYNQNILDDRQQVTNNRPANLFLYTFSGHNQTNIANLSAVTVTIKKGATNIYTGLTPTQIEKGVYKVNVWMSGTTPGDKYTDVWNGVSFGAYDSQDIEQTFQIQKNYYTSTIPNINQYSLSTYGLENNSFVNQDENIRVFCDLRVNYSTKLPTFSYGLSYRMTMNSQLEIIPWTAVNQIVLDNCKTNYFDIDGSWLLHNQTYQIDFRISEMGVNRVMPEKIIFKVIKPF